VTLKRVAIISVGRVKAWSRLGSPGIEKRVGTQVRGLPFLGRFQDTLVIFTFD
jgi:hypothetical protein